MREDTRRRLERALVIQRAKWIGSGVAALLFVAGGFWLTGLDAKVETRHVPGVVSYIGPLSGTSTKTIEEGLAVDVKLDDGRVVHVMALKTSEPHVGDRVEVAEHVHGSGRVTFSWH